MSTKTKERELKMIPLGDVVVVDGHNPRGKISTKDDAFKELVASIRQDGVLQAILVGPADGDGNYPIIAGHRRHAAAKAAKLKEIPATIAPDLNGSALRAAIAENLIREDMSPLQEARAIARLREQLGLKQTEAAKALGKSERWTRDREQLLAFPASLQKSIDKGEIPLEAGKTLAPIAKASPKAVELIVAAAKKDGEEVRLADKNVTGQFLADVASKAGLQSIHGQYGETPIGALPVPAAVKKKLKSDFDALPKHPYERRSGIRFNHADAKIAKERGVLLEFPVRRWGRTETLQLIADTDLVAERATKKIPAMKREIERVIKQQKEARTRNGPDKAQQEAARKEREEREAGAAAINDELGRKLSTLAPKASDVAAMRVICAMALGSSHYFETNVAHGLGAIAPEYNGSDGKSGAAVLLEQLSEAKTSDECVRLVLQMAIAAAFTEDTGYAVLGGPPGVKSMLEDLAEEADVLPQAVLDAIEAKRALPGRVLAVIEAAGEDGATVNAISEALPDCRRAFDVVSYLKGEGLVAQRGAPGVFVAVKEPAAT